MTLKEAVACGAKYIERQESIRLVCHLRKLSYTEFFLRENEPLDEETIDFFLKCVKKRQKDEPLQYITGAWEFMGLEFKTDKRALIPRPETELLVVEAVNFIKTRRESQNSPIDVLDVCTGSGCIAISIADAFDSDTVSVTATDISPDALSLARENAEMLLQAKKHVAFIQSDLLTGINDTFDAIISNPPYITSEELTSLSPSVREYEPLLALDGGVDGLDIYRRLIPDAFAALKTGGALFLETGTVSAENLMTEAGFENIRVLRDYAGHERILIGVKNHV